MEEDFECPICLDIYGISQSHIKAPKVLDCGDSICKECLEEIIKRSNEEFFLCPLCKEKTIKKENVDKYIPNKNLIKIINACYNISNKEIETQGDDKPTQYNIISLGNSAVGKTSIFQRLSKDIFSENSSTTLGCDTYTYNIKYKNKKYKLTLKDPSGQERYKSLTKSFLRKTDGVLFIYDISNQDSFNGLKIWYEFYKEENKEVVGLLIGNKCDWERKVNIEDAKKFAEEHGLKYLETSAKLDKNLRKAITYLLRKIIESKENIETEENIETNDGMNRRESYFSLSSQDAASSVQSKRLQKKRCGC